MSMRLLILIAAIECIHGVTFTCNYRAQTWYKELRYSYEGMQSNFYECRTTNGEIKSYETSVTNIYGNHLSGKSNSDVLSFDVENKEIYYFPTEMTEFFENLKSIRIKNSQLKRLREEDLEPFWDLRMLCLSGNKIERLDKNVFKHNNKLEYLSLDSNSFHTVTVGIFDNLIVLKSLLFRGNPCHSDLAFYNRNDVIKLIDQIENSCKSKLTNHVDVITSYNV